MQLDEVARKIFSSRLMWFALHLYRAKSWRAQPLLVNPASISSTSPEPSVHRSRGSRFTQRPTPSSISKNLVFWVQFFVTCFTSWKCMVFWNCLRTTSWNCLTNRAKVVSSPTVFQIFVICTSTTIFACYDLVGSINILVVLPQGPNPLSRKKKKAKPQPSAAQSSGN